MLNAEFLDKIKLLFDACIINTFLSLSSMSIIHGIFVEGLAFYLFGDKWHPINNKIIIRAFIYILILFRKILLNDQLAGNQAHRPPTTRSLQTRNSSEEKEQGERGRALGHCHFAKGVLVGGVIE